MALQTEAKKEQKAQIFFWFFYTYLLTALWKFAEKPPPHLHTYVQKT